jgi:hypothetical protein
LLAGCSSTTFLYNRLDFIIPWLMGDYIDLDREQRRQLDGLLGPFLAWHRAEELPAYIAVIERIEASLDQPLTIAGTEAVYADMESAWERLETRAVSWLLTVGEWLEDAQMADFLEALDEQQAEYEEKYLSRSAAEYREDAIDNITDSLQDYLGRLNDSQEQLVEDAAADLWRADRPWLEERSVWNERLRELLQREPGWQERVWQALAARPESVSQAYLETYAHNRQVLQSMLVEVLNQRTEKQDRRLRRRLQDLREDLETLVEQGLKTAA